jgi:hypothetical protein
METPEALGEVLEFMRLLRAVEHGLRTPSAPLRNTPASNIA